MGGSDPPQWEILELRRRDETRINNSPELINRYLRGLIKFTGGVNPHWAITKVKRLPDNVEFSIGDNAINTHNEYSVIAEITGIRLTGGVIFVDTRHERSIASLPVRLNNLAKVEVTYEIMGYTHSFGEKKIHQVRRKADGEVFTEGDPIKCEGSKLEPQRINWIELNKEGNVFLKTNKFSNHGISLQRAIKADIEFFCVNLTSWELFKYKGLRGELDQPKVRLFETEQHRKDFVEWNQPRYTKGQMVSFFNSALTFPTHNYSEDMFQQWEQSHKRNWYYPNGIQE